MSDEIRGSPSTRQILVAMWLGFAAIVAYGAIYPFDFQVPISIRSALDSFLRSCCGVPSRGDLLGNVMLMVPFGFLGVLAAGGRPRSFRIWSVTVAGLVLAFVLQLAQIFLPSRHESLQDVIWNLLGIMVGIQFGLLSSGFVQNRDVVGKFHLTPSVLIGSWLVYRLLPLVPSIDWQVIKNSLKPLVLAPELDAATILFDAAGWLVVASLLGQVRNDSRFDSYLPVIVAAVLVAEVVIVDNTVTAANVVGALVACMVWWTVLGQRRSNTGFLCVLLCTAVLVRGLTPLVLTDQPKPFAWLPFHGLLGGSMYVNVQAICVKVFIYGSLVHLLWQTRLGKSVAVVLGLLVVTGIEIVQVHLVSHTPEVTDPLLFILAALTVQVLHKFEHPIATATARPAISRGDRPDHSGRTPGAQTQEQTINLRLDQAAFLEQVAERMDVTVSEICRRIIDDFSEERAARPEADLEILDVLDENRDERYERSDWVKQSVLLRVDQVQLIELLADDAEESRSRLMRRLVARFMRQL